MNKALIEKLVKVMDAVGVVTKTGKNSEMGYSYRKYEDIANKLQPALAKEGLVICMVGLDMIRNEPGHEVGLVHYLLTDGTEELKFCGLGEGKDAFKSGAIGDKAAYKLQTGAMKYALNVLLMLAVAEEPEADGKDGKPAAQGQAKPAAQGQQNGAQASAAPTVEAIRKRLEACKTVAEVMVVVGDVEKNKAKFNQAQLTELSQACKQFKEAVGRAPENAPAAEVLQDFWKNRLGRYLAMISTAKDLEEAKKLYKEFPELEVPKPMGTCPQEARRAIFQARESRIQQLQVG